MPNKEIAKKLDCGLKTVTKWRNRYCNQQASLLEYEKGHNSKPVTNKELLDKIKEILSDAPRAGAPARLDEADINRLTALAYKLDTKGIGKTSNENGYKIVACTCVADFKKTNYAHIKVVTGFILKLKMNKNL